MDMPCLHADTSRKFSILSLSDLPNRFLSFDIDPDDDVLEIVDAPSLFNMDLNRLLAFLLNPSLRISPSASAWTLSASNLVFSLAISAKQLEKISNGMQPYGRKSDDAGVQCNSSKYASTHSPSLQPSCVSSSRSCLCEMQFFLMEEGITGKDRLNGH